MLNRRQCIAASAASTLCYLTASANRSCFATSDESTDAYVDVHVHIGTIPVGNEQPLTVEQLLREMDARNVAQAWVLPLVSPEAFAEPVSTQYVLNATKPYRDRLIPFCVIDPRNSWYVRGRKQILIDQLQRYIDAGAKGFGEHKPGIAIDDPRNMELYAACADLRLPIIFHLDARRNMDVPGLPGLEKVLSEFPDVPFIGHAHGFWASISGDVRPIDLGKYPKTKIAPGGALDRLFDKYDNLYGDISSGSGINALTRDPNFTIPFLKRRGDRLLFGTDYLKQGSGYGPTRSISPPRSARRCTAEDPARERNWFDRVAFDRVAFDRVNNISQSEKSTHHDKRSRPSNISIQTYHATAFCADDCWCRSRPWD